MELPRKIAFGEWLIDRHSGELSKPGVLIRLQAQPLQILEELLGQPGEIVPRERLIERLWPKGVVDFDTGLNAAMRKLRIALGDDADTPRYIETIPRRGYRLICHVRPHSDAGIREAATPDSEFQLNPTHLQQHQVGKKRLRRFAWPIVLGVAALSVLTLTASGVLWPQQAVTVVRPASIVVLPFKDMTEAKQEQPFCDGLADELSNWLAQIPTLRVVARTSAFAFRGRDIDARAIGKTLGTTHVLEGSLRRSGDTVRITVQLIDAGNGFHVWSGSFDSSGTDVIAMQEEVARAVAANLELRLAPTIDARFADRHGTNPKAYSSYLLARHHQQQLTGIDNERAIELYRAALAEEGDFALAKVGLASALLNQRYFNGRPIDEIAPQAASLLASVAATHPDLPDLYIARSALATDLKRREAAMVDLRRAVQLNKNSVDAISELGYYHLTAGEPLKALEFYTQAVSLDPLSSSIHSMRCLALADVAEFEDARFACERGRALNPSASWPYVASSLLEESRGDLVQALHWNRAGMARSPATVDAYLSRARLLLQLGAIAEAGQAYDAARSAVGGISAESVPLVHVGLLISVAQGGADRLRSYIAERKLLESDDPSLLVEAARAFLIVDDVASARQLVDRALSLKLDTSSPNAAWDARTGSSDLITIAAALQLTGERDSAARHMAELERLLNQLIANGVRRYGVLELQAQLAAMRGKQSPAMESLTQAATLGWRAVWQADNEPFFDALREREDYRALTQEIRTRNQRDASSISKL